MSEPKRQRGLGRGLAALFGEEAAAASGEAPAPAAGVMPPTAVDRGPPRSLPIERLHPNEAQPRRHYDEGALQALADSIAEQGVLQPIVVRPHPDLPGEYQIVAGERRWRAAQRARLDELPVVIRALDDRTALELALVENVQREDLQPLEEAEAYRRLVEEFEHSHETIGRAVGKSRSHVANMLRLLALPGTVKTWLGDGRLTAGHARALLTADDPIELGRKAVDEGWSVRELERRAKAEPRRPASPPQPKDADTVALERELTATLGLRVGIQHRDGAGVLALHYASLEQLDDLIARLRGGSEF